MCVHIPGMMKRTVTGKLVLKKMVLGPKFSVKSLVRADQFSRNFGPLLKMFNDTGMVVIRPSVRVLKMECDMEINNCRRLPHTCTVFPAKAANFRFEELQLKYFFHEIPMSYIC